MIDAIGSLELEFRQCMKWHFVNEMCLGEATVWLIGPNTGEKKF